MVHRVSYEEKRKKYCSDICSPEFVKTGIPLQEQIDRETYIQTAVENYEKIKDGLNDILDEIVQEIGLEEPDEKARSRVTGDEKTESGVTS